ncbi:hypothetical protein [Nostoc sp.]
MSLRQSPAFGDRVRRKQIPTDIFYENRVSANFLLKNSSKQTVYS